MEQNPLHPCPFCQVKPSFNTPSQANFAGIISCYNKTIVACRNPDCDLQDGHPQQRVFDWNGHCALHEGWDPDKYIKKYKGKWSIRRRK